MTSGTIRSPARNFSLMNFKVTGVPVEGRASRSQRLPESLFKINIYKKIALKITVDKFVPVNRLILKLSPDSLIVIHGGNTQELDELNKLKRSIIMDHVYIVCNEVLKDCDNLEESKS